MTDLPLDPALRDDLHGILHENEERDCLYQAEKLAEHARVWLAAEVAEALAAARGRVLDLISEGAHTHRPTTCTTCERHQAIRMSADAVTKETS